MTPGFGGRVPDVGAEQRGASQDGARLSIRDAPHALVVDTDDVIPQRDAAIFTHRARLRDGLHHTAIDSLVYCVDR